MSQIEINKVLSYLLSEPNGRPVSDYVDIEPQPNKHTKPRDRYRWLNKDLISPNTDFFF